MIKQKNVFLPDEASMIAFGTQLAQAALVPAVIFLHGQLGAGKTTLVRGFLRGLGYQDRVKSPTYTLVEPYELEEINVFHFDLYRLNDPHELEFMGVGDYFAANAICLLEWPEHGGDLLPEPDLSCYIETERKGRTIKLVASSPCGNTILQRLAHDSD
jgi:tRNA threonylcarbamoyladenosine biosynthesis protein TsaE